MKSDTFNKLAVGLTIVCWLGALSAILIHPEWFQWDFEVYYWATKTHGAGLNAHDPSDVARVVASSEERRIYYPYFPPSIWFFKPFTLLPLAQAKVLFLAVKCGLLFLLFFLWQSKLLKNPTDSWFGLFCLFAYGGPILLDLRAGNVTIFEQALIWCGLLAYMRARLTMFIILIAAASLFKLTPLALLGLLLVDNTPSSRRRLVSLVCAVLVASLIAWFAYPDAFLSFGWRALAHSEVEAMGISNPSAFSLIRYVSHLIVKFTGMTTPRIVQWGLYVCLAAVVVALSWKAFLRLNLQEDDERSKAAFLACLVYVLILPRFQDYQWMILLAPTYFLMLRIQASQAYPAIFLFSVLPFGNFALQGLGKVGEYYLLALAVGVWLIYLKMIHSGARESSSASGA